MSAAATFVAAPAERPRGSQWIESPFFDGLGFTAAPLIGLAFLSVLFTAIGRRPAGLAFFAIGMAHYYSTFTFFMGDENLAYARSRPLAYFGGPLVILAAVATLRFGAGLDVLLSAIFLWNAWHVSLQSCGIASLYRHRAGGDPREKAAVNLAIVGTSAALIAFAIPGFEPLNRPLRALSPALPLVILVVVATFALAAIVSLAVDIRRRIQAGRRYGAAEVSFLVSSLLLFHPYAWVSSSEIATAGMLMGHFVQYIALVWLLNRRKYASSQGSRAQNALSLASRRPAVAAAALLSLAGAWLLFDVVSSRFGVREVYFGLWNALVLAHFYLDGLIWSFKNPFVRRTMAPYLSRSVSSLTAPAVRFEPTA